MNIKKMFQFPKDDFESQVQKPQSKMLSWRALANFGEPTKDFWHLPQYYVTEGQFT